MSNTQGKQTENSSHKPHVIRTQRLELSVEDQSGAEQVQSRIEKMKSSVLSQQISDLFDSRVPQDVHISIDSLIVDLGDMALGEDFEQLFAEKLNEQLIQFVQNLNLQTPDEESTLADSNTSKVHSNTQRAMQLLVYYLEQGVLPWWENDKQWDVQTHFDELFKLMPEPLARQLSALSSYECCLRLVKQLEPSQIINLLQTWQQQSQQPIMALKVLVDEIVQSLRNALAQNNKKIPRDDEAVETEKLLNWLTRTSTPLAVLVWSFCESSRQPGHPKPISEQFLTRLIAHIVNDTALPKLQVIKNLHPIAKSIALTTQHTEECQLFITHLDLALANSETLPTKRAEDLTDTEKKPSVSDEKTSTASREENESKKLENTSDKPLFNDSLIEETSDPEKPFDFDPLIPNKHEPFDLVDQKYYIENAGLILLWPFLGHFFRDIGLTSEGEFSNIEDRLRGVLLTQYLITGQTQFVEHQLVLNKLLCGLALNFPTETKLKPNKAEKHSSKELIDSVLHHWQSLGNTSAEGFKQAFLQRQGVLSCQQSHWNLYIERKGFDILLEQLPWNIGVLSTKWMTSPIYVEW